MKLFIGSPAYNGMYHAAYLRFMLELQPLLMKNGVEMMFPEQPTDCYIARSRNYLANQFLFETDCTHLMFVDADMGFNAWDVRRMLACAGLPEYAVIGAGYPIRAIDWSKVKRAAVNHPFMTLEQLALSGQKWTMRFEQPEGEFEIDPDNPVPVAELPTGCMVIRRDVFQELHGPVFFDAKHDESGEFIGEDVRFCQRWRAIGGKVWLAPWVRSVHVGTYSFPGDLSATDGVLDVND
jgi:hypothetical protein